MSIYFMNKSSMAGCSVGINLGIDEYPDLHNHDLPLVLGCAEARNLANASLAFRRCRHGLSYIYEVEPVKSATFPFCRWSVKYRMLNNGEIPETGVELQNYFKSLIRLHPMNASVISYSLSDEPPKSAIVEYGVDTCECPRPSSCEKRNNLLEDENVLKISVLSLLDQ